MRKLLLYRLYSFNEALSFQLFIKSECVYILCVCVCVCVCESRSSSLSAVNAMLREQLEQAGLANEALSQDIRRLTADWTKAREELEQREADWRREEEVGRHFTSSSAFSDIVFHLTVRYFQHEDALKGIEVVKQITPSNTRTCF